VGKIVGSRSQTAGGKHEVRSGGGLRKGSYQAPFVVSDGSVAIDNHTQSREPTAEPSCVRIEEAPKEYLGADGYDLGARRVQIVYVVQLRGFLRRCRVGVLLVHVSVEPRGFEPLRSAVKDQDIIADVRRCSKIPANKHMLP
jgi:hypothetical protein